MLIFFLSLLFFSIDFFLKKFIQVYLPYDTAFSLIKHIADIRVVHNRGAAFGILQAKTPLLIFMGVVFLLVFIFWIIKATHSLREKIFLSMILGGALCNLYDRVVFGYVIDYIDLGWWPVFNLSDTFITLGCIFFIIMLLRKGDRHVF